MGRIRCPLLVIAGDDDQNWPASESAADVSLDRRHVQHRTDIKLTTLLSPPTYQMQEMMSGAGNAHLLTVLLYPNTGHLIEPPYSPHTRSSSFRSVTTQEKGAVTLQVGGTKVGWASDED